MNYVHNSTELTRSTARTPRYNHNNNITQKPHTNAEHRKPDFYEILTTIGSALGYLAIYSQPGTRNQKEAMHTDQRTQNASLTRYQIT